MRSTSYGEQGIEKHPEKGSTLGIWGGPGHLLLDDSGLASWHVPSQQNPGPASLEKVTTATTWVKMAPMQKTKKVNSRSSRWRVTDSQKKLGKFLSVHPGIEKISNKSRVL